MEAVRKRDDNRKIRRAASAGQPQFCLSAIGWQFLERQRIPQVPRRGSAAGTRQKSPKILPAREPCPGKEGPEKRSRKRAHECWQTDTGNPMLAEKGRPPCPRGMNCVQATGDAGRDWVWNGPGMERPRSGTAWVWNRKPRQNLALFDRGGGRTAQEGLVRRAPGGGDLALQNHRNWPH